MSWETIYLVCFLIGFLLSLISLLAGNPHLHFHGFHHAHTGTHAAPALNLGTVSAFFAWFGGTGYLLTRYSAVQFAVVMTIAAAGGIAGAGLVFWFVAKVLISREENLDPEDYSMIGVLGKLSSSIREAGTGEMIFSQAGTRRTTGARSEDGMPIPKGAEVVVTRYEKGIAYVRRWEDLSDAHYGS